jgi:DNA-binding PadR family transcriptional regulator
MSKPRLPPVTHLQFLVLACLAEGEQPGRGIREAISAYGIRRSAPAFYQMMARLERARLVEGWYEQITVGDQAVTERRYRIRPAGHKLWQETLNFYRSAAGAPARQGWSDV